jgi:hypothetical protein
MAKLNLKKVLEDLVEVQWLEDPEEKEKAFDLLKAISQDDSEEAIEFITKLNSAITEIVKGDEVEEIVPEEKEELDEAKLSTQSVKEYIKDKKEMGYPVAIFDKDGNIIETYVDEDDIEDFEVTVSNSHSRADIKSGKYKDGYLDIKGFTEEVDPTTLVAIDEKKKMKTWRMIKEGTVVDMEQYEESLDKEAIKKLVGEEFDDVEEELEESTETLTEASNPEVIKMFIDDSFPKDKKPVWGTDNLKITKIDNGWALVNYSTPILFRNSNNKMFMNTEKYSATTSKIQNAIKTALGDKGFKEVDENGIKDEIEKEQLKEEKENLTESYYDGFEKYRNNEGAKEVEGVLHKYGLKFKDTDGTTQKKLLNIAKKSVMSSEATSELSSIENDLRKMVNESSENIDEAARKPVKLFVGHFGNGLSVSDSNREEHGDYKKLAHIDRDRKITWYAKVDDETKKKLKTTSVI